MNIRGSLTTISVGLIDRMKLRRLPNQSFGLIQESGATPNGCTSRCTNSIYKLIYSAHEDGVLGCFAIYKEDTRPPEIYSTAKHSGATDEDGDHGSLTEPTREGPSGSPEVLGP